MKKLLLVIIVLFFALNCEDSKSISKPEFSENEINLGVVDSIYYGELTCGTTEDGFTGTLILEGEMKHQLFYENGLLMRVLMIKIPDRNETGRR